MITVTDRAASHLLALLESKDFSPSEKGLRLFVEKGGCAGMQYAMRIDSPAEGDLVAEKDGARVFVAPDSLEYLQDCRLDYLDALNDAGFKIDNPNAARSCGCGTSFEPSGAGQSSGQSEQPAPETADALAEEGACCG